MTTTPRKFDSEIKITSKGKWLYRGQEVTQDNILNFFKKNLKEDDLGIYIQNNYGDLEEHGYIEANTIFLKVHNTDTIEETVYFETEDNSNLPLTDFNFYSDSEEKIFCMKKSDKFLKFRFNRKTHSFISDLIEEADGEYFIIQKEIKIPILPYNENINVEIPSIYKKKKD